MQGDVRHFYGPRRMWRVRLLSYSKPTQLLSPGRWADGSHTLAQECVPDSAQRMECGPRSLSDSVIERYPWLKLE